MLWKFPVLSALFEHKEEKKKGGEGEFWAVCIYGWILLKVMAGKENPYLRLKFLCRENGLKIGMFSWCINLVFPERIWWAGGNKWWVLLMHLDCKYASTSHRFQYNIPLKEDNFFLIFFGMLSSDFFQDSDRAVSVLRELEEYLVTGSLFWVSQWSRILQMQMDRINIMATGALHWKKGLIISYQSACSCYI